MARAERSKTNKRPGIPPAVADEILFRADHTCCICRTRGKDVQLHHIVGKPSDNAMTNLALVCLDCHSRITGSRGLGKSYTPGEVRRYKLAWDHAVQRSRGVHRPKIEYRRELISQVDLIVCEILATDSDPKRVAQLLDVLIQLHIWRGNRALDNKIIEGLRHLSVMGGLGSTVLAPIVAEKLWEMCWHLVGPHEVRMDREGERYVFKCIDALDTLAHFNSEFGRGRKAADKIADSAERFFEVAVWYRRPRIAGAVLKLYDQALTSCATDGLFRYGDASLRRSLRRARRIISKEGGWERTRKRVDEILGRQLSRRRQVA